MSEDGTLDLFQDAPPDEVPSPDGPPSVPPKEPGTPSPDRPPTIPVPDPSPAPTPRPPDVPQPDPEPTPTPGTPPPRPPPPGVPPTGSRAAIAGGGDGVAAPGDPVERATPASAGEVATGAGSESPRVWSVSEVNRAVARLLEDTLPTIWVGGEVTNWTRARSGHRYFTLKDDEAQIRCVMWRGDAARLPADPDEGMEVRAFGSLGLYEVRGEYQLAVRKLEADGAEGLWRLAFERLRRKLDAEGLLAPERKRPVPRFPRCVGVVTSTTGAALRDVLTVVRRRAPWTRVVVRGTRVQGEGAAGEIAAALRALAGCGLCDVIIVGRGGGSIEDLWAFNEEAVARAIAECPVPVISAVGHEVDVTIADLVADRRAPTPSAAGEAAVRDGAEIRDGLRSLPPRLARALTGCVEARRTAIRAGADGLGRGVRRLVEIRERRLESVGAALEGELRTTLRERRARLSAVAGKMEALSPLGTLRRGYAVPLDGDGRVLRRIEDFPAGAEFGLRVIDGRVRARTEATEADPLERAVG